MQGLRRRMLVGALRRPDAAYYWFRAALRIRRNRRFRRRVAGFSPATAGPKEVCSAVGISSELAPQEMAELTGEYRRMREQVYRRYGVRGTGRIPSIITEDDAAVLYCLIRAARPRYVLETGVSDGMSSWVILRGLAANQTGTLVSVDYPLVGLPRLYGLPPGWIIPEELRRRWDLHLGPSTRVLPELFAQQPQIDLFVHDSEHSMENMAWEMRTAHAHLAPGGLLIADDALANDAFLDAAIERASGRRWTVTKEGLGVLRIDSLDPGPPAPVHVA